MKNHSFAWVLGVGSHLAIFYEQKRKGFPPEGRDSGPIFWFFFLLVIFFIVRFLFSLLFLSLFSLFPLLSPCFLSLSDGRSASAWTRSWSSHSPMPSLTIEPSSALQFCLSTYSWSIIHHRWRHHHQLLGYNAAWSLWWSTRTRQSSANPLRASAGLNLLHKWLTIL